MPNTINSEPMPKGNLKNNNIIINKRMDVITNDTDLFIIHQPF